MNAGRRAYPWLVVALLWAIWLINYLDRQVIFSVFPLIKTEFKPSDFELGLVSTSFLWVYAFASPLAGYLADRFGSKAIIVISLLVWSAVTWATGHVRTFPELLLARGLMGISEACYLPAGLALIAAWHGSSTRSTATGIHYSGGYIGMILGGALGGWLGAHYGWRFAFVCMGTIGVLYAVIVFLLLRDRPVETGAEGGADPIRQSFISTLGALFRAPNYTPMFTVFAAISIGNWIVYTWLPLYLNERFGMSLAEAGFTATFYLQPGSGVGILLGGRISDAWSASNSRARILTQAAGLAAAAPFLFLSGFTGTVALLICGMFVFGLGRGAYDANCMPALCEIVPEGLRASGFGLFNFIGPLAGGLFAGGAGALKSTIGIGGALEVCGLLLGVSVFLLLRIRSLTVAAQ
jgi:MFS family permease